MARYVLSVIRTTQYAVEADTPEGAWDAYLRLPEAPSDYEDTNGHFVQAQAPDHDTYPDPFGPVLSAEGDLVPPVGPTDTCSTCGRMREATGHPDDDPSVCDESRATGRCAHAACQP
jgi:hypothetical protein